MDVSRRRKRTDSFTPPLESPKTTNTASFSSRISPSEKRRREIAPKNSSTNVGVEHVVRDISRIVTDHNLPAIRSQILSILKVDKRDASTQTESSAFGQDTSVKQTSSASLTTFHIPAVNVIGGTRKRKRNKSLDSPTKRTPGREPQSPDVKSPNKIGKTTDINPDDIYCAICSKPASCIEAGYLYGPYKAETEHSLKQGTLRKSGKRRAVSITMDELYWIHDMCSVWSQGVYLNGTTLEGLTKAIQTGAISVSPSLDVLYCR